jgi:hypothetical protein
LRKPETYHDGCSVAEAALQIRRVQMAARIACLNSVAWINRNCAREIAIDHRRITRRIRADSEPFRQSRKAERCIAQAFAAPCLQVLG